MKIKDYFAQRQDKMPEWLSSYAAGQAIDMKKVLESRSLYYPGVGYDGEPIHVFNQAHAVHLYIIADYGCEKDKAAGMLKEEGAFKGYNLLDFKVLKESDLTPYGWVRHLPRGYVPDYGTFPVRESFYYLAIYERQDSYGEEHGAKRFALIYAGGDGIAAYDAIYANRRRAPYVLVLQDHGFGGNYDRFGKGGLMESIAKTTATFPAYAFVGENTPVWAGYEKIPDVDKEYASHWRSLYIKK